MTALYDAQHAELLAQGLPRFTKAVSALDLACGRGVATRHLLPLLPAGSRIVALSSQRELARALHEQLDPSLRERVFVRKESAHRLPFANAVFDVAWACFAFEPLEPQKAVVRQALRVLRPGSTLLVCAVLRETFVELLRLVSSYRSEHEDSQRSRPLVVDHSHVLDQDEWLDLLRRCGALDIRVEKRRFDVTLAVPPSQDELLTTRLVPQWLGEQKDTAREALATLDKMVHAPVTLPVTIACFRCLRGTAEPLPLDESAAGAAGLGP